MFENIRKRFKFEIWKNIHSFSQDLIDFWQLRELRRIMKHAYSNTALYHDLWKGRKTDDIRKLSDLESFPIIKKETFLKSPLEGYIGILRPQPYRWCYTSGTSGQPFSFISIHNRDPLRDIFLAYRFLYWQGFSPEAILKLPRVRIYATTAAKEVVDSFTSFSVNEFLSKKEAVIGEISKIQPIALISYPSILVELARAVNRFPRFKDIGIKYAVSYGENLTQLQRKFVEDALHCEVYNRYGLEEFGVVGIECRQHNGFHINVESFFLEIVDESGYAVSKGTKGGIVITDFRNYAMPFVRYDTGDFGYFLLDRCQCGLDGLRLVVEGRIGEFLELGSRKVHHLEFDKVVEGFTGAVLQYQVVRMSENMITLSIISGPAMNKFVLNHIQEKIEVLIGSTCQLKIELVSEIKRTPQGKCQTLIAAQCS